MQDINLFVQPADGTPPETWNHQPSQLMIRMMQLNPDMKTVHLLCMTYTFPDVQPPFTARTVIVQEELDMPLDVFSSAFNSDGTINNDAANSILAGFHLQITQDTPEEIERSKTGKK